jgi:hypothetical protein
MFASNITGLVDSTKLNDWLKDYTKVVILYNNHIQSYNSRRGSHANTNDPDNIIRPHLYKLQDTLYGLSAHLFLPLGTKDDLFDFDENGFIQK